MIKGYTSENFPTKKNATEVNEIKHPTVVPVGTGRHALDVFSKQLAPRAEVNLIPEATSTESRIDLAGHTAQIGDTIVFKAGPRQYEEVVVIGVDAGSIYLGHKFSTPITAADEFWVYAPISMKVDLDGNLVVSQGPIQFIRNGLVEEVEEDTVTPANNRPLPVKLSSVTGDINITANDLNVQTSHDAVNFDSMRIGDGTNLMGVNADLEALTHDADTHTRLDTANTSLGNIDGKVSTEAKQDTIITELQDIEADIEAGNLLLTSIDGKVSTEAKQDDIITQVTAINAKVATEAKQDTIISEIQTANSNLVDINSKVSTEIKQDAIISELGDIKLALEGQDIYVRDGAYVAQMDFTGNATLAIGNTLVNGLIYKEIEVLYQDGVTMEIYADNGVTLLGRVTQGGGKIRVSHTAVGTDRIHLKAVDAGVTTVDNVVLNVLA
jgi:outer membrane murein-binding lipoprotein Lpp